MRCTLIWETPVNAKIAISTSSQRQGILAICTKVAYPVRMRYTSAGKREASMSPVEPTRRAVLGAALSAAALATVPSGATATAPIILDDASYQNATPVARHIIVGPDHDSAVIATLRAELKDAAAANRPVAVGVARHSMGGQSLIRNGTALSLDGADIIPDIAAGTYRARLGTRWRDVIAELDPLGFSPKVMQSNNDFGLTSTFSVNAHGRSVPRSPFGSTVRAIRLMLADGTVLTCSPRENVDLFQNAMGGYGLFGIILDLEVEMIPNVALMASFQPLGPADFAAAFVAACHDPAVSMAYGRLDVSRAHFLNQTLLVTYRDAPQDKAALYPARAPGMISSLSRDVYRAEIGSDFAKKFRWFMETTIGPKLEHGPVTRNTLLNEAVAVLANHDPRRTDILHEYFVPPERFADFLTACREVIPASQQELLNVTMRFVDTDHQSTLAFAPGPRIASVMSFSQLRTPAADADMKQMTQSLIARVIALGGSFYLPYRLHERRDQLAAAYPRLDRFIVAKRHYDPGLRFQNTFWTSLFA